jgi:phosphatidylinositol glycan class T
MRAIWWAVLLLLLLVGRSHGQEMLREKMVLRPLGDGKLMAHVRISIDGTSVEATDFDLAPKSVVQLLAAHRVATLHVSLGAGRWYAEQWGSSGFPAPEGLQVAATFRGQSSWEGLLHALGGLLGASATLLRGSSTAVLADGTHLAAFGGETVCTENLTPWLSLLPCRDRAGLGTLLNPLNVFRAPHHALGLSASVSDAGEVAMAFDLAAVFAGESHRYWTMQSVFGKASLSACPLASSTLVTLDGSLNTEALASAAAGEHVIEASSMFDFKIARVRPTRPVTPVLTAVRYLTGFGLERGGMKTVIRNPGSKSVTVDYLELLPWYFRVEKGTVAVESVGEKVELSLTESIERQSATVLRLDRALLPANETLVLTYQFTKAFLHLSEHPPDAHHGFFIPGARVTAASEHSVLYTDVLVAQVALPDFSMPFNVVTMSGVIVGFAFGSTLGIVTARYSLLKRGQQIHSTRPLARLLRFLLALIDRFA